MAFQRTLSGEISQWDPNTKAVSIKYRRWEAGQQRENTAAFSLDQNVTVTDRSYRPLKLTELKVGQQVAVEYVTEPGGRQAAKAIRIQSLPAPTGGQGLSQQAAPTGVKPAPRPLGPQPSPKPA